MNKKLISSLVAGLALSAAAVAPAQATSMQFVAGGITMTLGSMLDQGTTGYYYSGKQPQDIDTGLSEICSGVGACNIPGLNYGANSFGDDSWGIFSVLEIRSNVTGNKLWEASTNNYLTGMFYGLQDDYVTALGVNSWQQINTYSIGGQVDLYWNASDINTTTVDASSRTASNVFAGITGGTLAASAKFNPTANSNVPQSTYTSSYNYASISGGGSGYLDIVPGSGNASSADSDPNTINLASMMLYADQWAGTSYDPLETPHDAYLQTTFSRAFTTCEGVGCTSQQARGWSVYGSGDITSKIPEPGSMALVGLGLMGLAGLRRRKEKA